MHFLKSLLQSEADLELRVQKDPTGQHSFLSALLNLFLILLLAGVNLSSFPLNFPPFGIVRTTAPTTGLLAASRVPLYPSAQPPGEGWALNSEVAQPTPLSAWGEVEHVGAPC